MGMLEQINQNYLEAYKQKDELKTSVLRMLKSSLKNLEINQKSAPSDDQIITEIKKMVKQTKEAKFQFEEGNRKDLAEKSDQELKILEQYLPTSLTQEEIIQIIEKTAQEIGASSLADFGRLMGASMSKTKGAADGSIVSELVKKYLTK